MKIRGNTIGTPLKPEKNLVKATNLTAEEQAQARANIGADQVFIAEYGKTSFAEMDEARAAGKLLFLHTGNNIVPMYDHVAGSSVSFYRITSSQVINYYRTAKGNWSNKTINLCDERLTGIESNLGDIESALDTIIAIQEELINNGGGDGDYEYYCDNCGAGMNDPFNCDNCGATYSTCEWCGTRYNSDDNPPCDCESGMEGSGWYETCPICGEEYYTEGGPPPCGCDGEMPEENGQWFCCPSCGLDFCAEPDGEYVTCPDCSTEWNYNA